MNNDHIPWGRGSRLRLLIILNFRPLFVFSFPPTSLAVKPSEGLSPVSHPINCIYSAELTLYLPPLLLLRGSLWDIYVQVQSMRTLLLYGGYLYSIAHKTSGFGPTPCPGCLDILTFPSLSHATAPISHWFGGGMQWS